MDLFLHRLMPCWVLCVGLGMPWVCSAQIVNVFSGLPFTPAQGWGAGADAAVSWRTGNSDALSVGTGGQVFLQKGSHLGYVTARYRVVSQLGRKSVNQTYEHVRYRYSFTPKLALESYLQHEWDVRLLLDVRMLAGAGLRWVCVDHVGWGVALGAGYLFEYEALQQPSPGEGTHNTHTRVSSYAQFSYALDERIRLQNVLFVQPRITPGRFESAVGDVLLMNEASVTVKITRTLNMKTTFMLRYDSRPPGNIKGMDTLLETSLGWVL
jgi:putative salt-induced outer membrane protein YdiY